MEAVVKKVLGISVATWIAAIAALMAFSAGAQAQEVFGQLAPGTSPPALCEEPPGDLIQAHNNEGALYEVPDTAGVITSWSTNAAAGANQMLELKVFREVSHGVFVVVAHDGPRPLTPSVVNTFKVNIPVTAGEQIGLNNANSLTVHNACEFFTGEDHDTPFFFPGNAGDGATIQAPGEGNERRLNLSATFLPPPALEINGRVALGSIAGGGAVVLKGLHLAEVSAVSFGGVPAKSFTVNSEQQITVVAPAGTTLGEISAKVTTAAGSTETAPVFSYSGCAVPKLAGKKLKAAKTLISGAGCKLGKVKKVRGSRKKAGKVLKQSPKPGTVLAPGSKVSIKVGK
jgi:hypothetical protein